MNRILVIVDPQNDFVSGNLPVEGAKEAMKNIVSELVMEKYSYIIVTVDWHPFDHCSFNYKGGEWPTHCVKYTWGAAIVPNISSMLIELGKRGIDTYIVNKGQYSYKEEYGAFESDCSILPDFSDEITICGVAGDYCVYETTKNLLKMGYSNIIMLTDCIASTDGGAKLKELIEEYNLKSI